MRLCILVVFLNFISVYSEDLNSLEPESDPQGLHKDGGKEYEAWMPPVEGEKKGALPTIAGCLRKK